MKPTAGAPIAIVYSNVVKRKAALQTTIAVAYARLIWQILSSFVVSIY